MLWYKHELIFGDSSRLGSVDASKTGVFGHFWQIVCPDNSYQNTVSTDVVDFGHFSDHRISAIENTDYKLIA